MPDTSPHPAKSDEIAEALAFAFRYEGRERVHHADDFLARITAERLVRPLEQRGFVLIGTPGAVAPSSSGLMPPRREPNE